jgi:hypothetical protein
MVPFHKVYPLELDWSVVKYVCYFNINHTW